MHGHGCLAGLHNIAMRPQHKKDVKDGIVSAVVPLHPGSYVERKKAFSERRKKNSRPHASSYKNIGS
jgi:hypothetical protein